MRVTCHTSRPGLDDRLPVRSRWLSWAEGYGIGSQFAITNSDYRTSWMVVAAWSLPQLSQSSWSKASSMDTADYSCKRFEFEFPARL